MLNIGLEPLTDVEVADENNGLGGGGDGQGPSVLLASSVGGGVVGEECWAREVDNMRGQREGIGITLVSHV